ncbi:hypothetical protein V6N13_091427 [Hibiscus sabdariffa]
MDLVGWTTDDIIGKQQAGKKQQQACEQQIDEQRVGDKQQVREQQTRDQRKQQTAELEHEREKQSISVFVENIPNAMHWKGLWHAFARHGDVTDTYIPRKLSRRGKRFGFVRMKSRKDALRVIERLNGFLLYGYRLTVQMARFNKGMFRKKNSETQGPNYWLNGMPRRTKVVGESSNHNWGKPKRISGHVEEEELWKLKRCLVGEMASICSVRSIDLRLQKWGLGEIRVQRMGSKLFLLSFEDDELYMMLEDLNWSYLREIFLEDVHCIAGTISLWREWLNYGGTFEALGENFDHRKGYEKVSILISTNQAKRIEEVIEIEVGSMIFEVGVNELGFSDNSTEGVMAKFNPMTKKDVQDSGSTSGSSFDPEKNVSPVADRSCSRVKEEALNAVCAENSVSVEKSGDKILESKEFIKSDNLGEAKIIKKSAWNSNSDSSPIAEKRSECGESAGNNFLGNSESNKLVGLGNINLEKNNLDGEESNRQFDEKSTSQFGKEYIQDKVNKRSWAAVVAKSGPDLLLETGGSQVQNDKESVNPISPNKVVTAPNNWDMPHSASSGGSIHGHDHQGASLSWAQTIDLVNSKLIQDFVEIGNHSNQSEAEDLVESEDEEHNLNNMPGIVGVEVIVFSPSFGSIRQEHSWCSNLTLGMEEFKIFIQLANMIDIPLKVKNSHGSKVSTEEKVGTEVDGNSPDFYASLQLFDDRFKHFSGVKPPFGGVAG